MDDINLTGTWDYEEEHEYGSAKGRLFLLQEGKRLWGRIVFTDMLTKNKKFTVQEIIRGEINEKEVKLRATDCDIIATDGELCYELDNWTGNLVDEDTIEGTSVDVQGVEGDFKFIRLSDQLPQLLKIK